jgi:Leucine-rich repeat (LRR) protein
MSELARQLIEREKRERTGYLNLGACGLRELPDLSELVGLETLILSDRYWDWEQQKMVEAPNMGGPNDIRALHSDLLPLGITRIVLSNLGMSKGSFLEQLTSLTYLDISSNLINDWSFIETLPNLTSLNVSFNHSRDWSFLEKLLNLTFLNLSSSYGINNIAFISKLTKLTYLNLS